MNLYRWSILVLLALSSSAWGGNGLPFTKTYKGPTNGNWADASNWNSPGVPGNNDWVDIEAPSNVQFDYDYQSEQVDELWVAEEATLWQSQGRLAVYDYDLLGTGVQTGGILNVADLGAFGVLGTYFLSGSGVIQGAARVQGAFYQSGDSVVGALEGTGDFNIAGGNVDGSAEFGAGARVSQTAGSLNYGVTIGQPAFPGAAMPTFYDFAGGTIASEAFIEGQTTFIQSGGTIQDIRIGDQAKYFLSGGTVNGLVEAGGINSSIVFTQSGGQVHATHLDIAPGTDYQYFGGDIATTDLSIAGAFTQAGPAVSAFDVLLSQGGSYNLDGSVTTTTEEIEGTLIQTGGLNQIGAGHGAAYIAPGASYHLVSGSIDVASLSNAGMFIVDSRQTAPYTAPVITSSDFLQYNIGTLQLDDLLPSSDQLLFFSNSASLLGTLSITLDASYSPMYGDFFMLIESPSVTGTFTAYDLPVLSSGFSFAPIYTDTTFGLLVVPEPGLALSATLLALVLWTRAYQACQATGCR